jgi:phospholipid N-methyltransferase
LIRLQRLRFQPDKRLAFLQGFLKYPHLVGSVIPSSRFLERRLIESSGAGSARIVVELGPGTGGTTRAIMRAMRRDARLLAIEINPQFASLLQSEPDPRLTVYHGSAEHIREALRANGMDAPDVVVSGIPFSTISPKLGSRIIQEVWDSLAPGGRFVAYQFRDRVAILGRELLGDPRIEVEFLNVPPMRFYCWDKPVERPKRINGERYDGPEDGIASNF